MLKSRLPYEGTSVERNLNGYAFGGSGGSHSPVFGGLRWYVAETKTGQGETANEHLLRQGFEICHPTLVASVKQRKQYREVLRPLFPGYVLVNFDVMEEGWQRINGTRGVKRLICGAGSVTPLPVPQRVMVELLARMKGGPLRDTTWMSRFLPGQKVVVTEGPLTGYTGTCQMSERDRVWILLNFLGAERAIQFNEAHVDAVL